MKTEELESQEAAKDYQPVSVAAARQIAESFAKNWVVILAGDEAHDKLHTVTYGRSPAEKMAAAAIGEFLATALGFDLKQSRFFEDFRAVSAAEARAEIEAAWKRIAELEAALQPQWIPVSERLPEDVQDVWFNSVDGNVTFGFFCKELCRFASDDGTFYHRPSITHWMPATRPQPPKEVA